MRTGEIINANVRIIVNFFLISYGNDHAIFWIYLFINGYKMLHI